MPRAAAAEAGRIDLVVSRTFPEITRSRAAALIRDGAVQIDGVVVARAAQHVPAGATVEVTLPALVPDIAVPQDLPLRVVFEDDAVLVVDKDAGMVVHPAPGHADGTLVNALLHHVEDLSGIGGVQRPGIVHRLDRGTSGLLVVAKSDAAHQALAAQFAAHTAGRTYLALCQGVPVAAAGTIRSTLGRHPKDRLKFASGPNGKPAVTHWRRVGVAGTIALVECRLETGRTHQVRVHVSEQGWPIVGDPLYGRKVSQLPATLRNLVDPERPLLHAWALRFTHPDGRAMAFEAPLPADFAAALAAVGIPIPGTPGLAIPTPAVSMLGPR